MAKLLFPAEVREAAAAVVELSWSNVGEEGGGAGLYWEKVCGAELGFDRVYVYLHVTCKKSIRDKLIIIIDCHEGGVLPDV